MTGTVRGLSNVHDYDLFFDWFNPDYFKVTGEIMQLLITNDEVC